MQMPDILSDPASVSGRSGNGADSGGSGFNDLHQSLLSDRTGDGGLQPGDTLRNAEGNVIGRIVRGDEGGLRLALQGREGDGIPLEQLASLLEEQEGDGLDALQGLFSGELELGTDGSEWLQQLEDLTEEEQQGVLTALAGLNDAQGGKRLPLMELLGQGDNGVRNSTSNFLQSLLSGMAQNGQSGESGSTDLRFEGLRLVAVEASGGQDANSRGSEVAGLAQQAFTRGEAPREATLRQYTTTVETPVQQQTQWSEQVAGKIAWIAGRSIQSADIQLNPPEMGPIDVRISVQNDQAQVTVNAQNTQVREMLEANSSRLRDMLEQEGLSLADLNVSGDAPGGGDDGSGDDSPSHGGGTEPARPGDNGETIAAGEMAIRLDDSIDTYA